MIIEPKSQQNMISKLNHTGKYDFNINQVNRMEIV